MTKHKQEQEQEELLEKEERLNALMDHNPSLIFLKDEEGRYVYLNKAYEDFILSGNWYGKTDFDFWPKESAELFRTNDAYVLKSEQTMQFLEDSTDMEGKMHCWVNYKFPFTDSKNQKYVGGIGIDATRLILAEEALKESETKYHALVKHSPAGICEFDFSTKRFTSVNDAMCMLTGYRRDELLSMHPLEIFDGESRAKFRQRMIQFFSGEKPEDNVDYVVITKDGRLINAVLDVKLIKDKNGNLILAYMAAYDITERKRVEEALAAAHRQIQSIIDNTPDSVYAFDLEERFVLANTALAALLKSTPEQMIGKRRCEFMPREDADWHEANDRRVIEEGKALEFEEYSQLNGRSITWLTKKFPLHDAQGRIYAVAGNSADITEHKRTEEALRESEERYRAVVQSTNAVILRLNPQGIIRFANRRALEFFGYTEDELIGKSALGKIVPERDATGRDHSEMVKRISANPDRFHSNANENIRKNGERIWMEWTNSGIYDTEGHLKESIAVGIDVTERKRAEEALRQSEQKAQALVKELEEADRNKNQFISILSHELRNPLAAISAGVQILDITKDINQTEKAKEIMKRQTNQLCKLVDDLLELTRITQNKIKLKKESINLNEIVKGAVEDIRPEYEKKGVKLCTKIQARPIFLDTDPMRITQSIGNILFNALKFTQANGTVCLTLKTERNNAVIRVKDNGIGMSPELLPHLFKPFTQADHSLDRQGGGGGLGLGLSIVKGIIDLHEGSVSAYSEGLEKGSTFIVRLPIITGDNLMKEKQTSNTAKKTFNILIIEDNKDFAELLSSIFKLNGHEISIALDGIEGIEKAKKQTPDVILCDIGLPGLNGYEVARKVREDHNLKNVYMIALTGYAGSFDAELAKKSGFDKHLSKPVDMAILGKIFLDIDRQH